ncbi:VOC family protein [Halomonas sp. AOP13-D3-9]
MKLNLLVLRCKELETSKQFYELLGFTFVKEKHGGGPSHYSSQNAGFVFELYPLAENETVGNTRVGFSVKHIPQVLSQMATATQQESNGKQVCIVRDPDGRKVELRE